MSDFTYMSKDVDPSKIVHVVKGHNKKFTIVIDGRTYYVKYDSEKEIKGNMQKRFASSFCSFLAQKYGGNLVKDVPGEAIVETVSKEYTKTKLKCVFSQSYKDDYHIGITFTLDEVLKPRENENFLYNNEKRVFASVENTMTRLRSYIEMQQKNDENKQPFSLFSNFKSLEEDYVKIQDDLVNIVLLDYLFLNNDRHTENIEFSIIFDDKGDYHLVVSPIFDNDRSFGLDKDEKTIIEDCSSKSKREAYVDYCADVKYTIRNKDCDNAFASEMNFANNYHSDVLADYIKNSCMDQNGEVDRQLMANHPVYQLYQSYKDVDIKKEFYEFLSNVAQIENVYSPDMSLEQEKRFVEEFNKKTDSTLSINHIMEVTQNFNNRQNNLNESVHNKLPIMNIDPLDLIR